MHVFIRSLIDMFFLLMYCPFHLVDLSITYIVQIFQEAVNGNQAEDRSEIENATFKFHCFVELNLIKT